MSWIIPSTLSPIPFHLLLLTCLKRYGKNLTLVFVYATALAVSSRACIAKSISGQATETTGVRTQVQDALQRLTAELYLTDDQKAQIEPILQKAFEQIKDAQEGEYASSYPRRMKLKEILDNTISRIRPILTLEQERKLAAMKEPLGDIGLPPESALEGDGAPDGAPDEPTPTQAPPPEIGPSDSAKLQAAVDALPLGQVLFHHPAEMEVKKPETVRVRISQSLLEDLSHDLKRGGVRGAISKLQGDMGDAKLAALITLEEPSRGMIEKAHSAGSYTHDLTGRTCPKIRIVTIEEMLAKKPARLELPQNLEALKSALRALESQQMKLNLQPIRPEKEETLQRKALHAGRCLRPRVMFWQSACFCSTSAAQLFLLIQQF